MRNSTAVRALSALLVVFSFYLLSGDRPQLISQLVLICTVIDILAIAYLFVSDSGSSTRSPVPPSQPQPTHNYASQYQQIYGNYEHPKNQPLPPKKEHVYDLGLLNEQSYKIASRFAEVPMTRPTSDYYSYNETQAEKQRNMTNSYGEGYTNNYLDFSHNFLDEDPQARDRGKGVTPMQGNDTSNRANYNERFSRVRGGQERHVPRNKTLGGKSTMGRSDIGFNGRSSTSTSPYRPQSHYYDKRSVATGNKITVSKRSTMSMRSGMSTSRILGGDNSASERVKGTLNELNIDSRLFNMWSGRKLKPWINTKLCADVIKRNKENFAKINTVLSHFNTKLREYELFNENLTTS